MRPALLCIPVLSRTMDRFVPEAGKSTNKDLEPQCFDEQLLHVKSYCQAEAS